MGSMKTELEIENTTHVQRTFTRITQQQLADVIGVTRTNIVALEKGNYNPSLTVDSTLFRLRNRERLIAARDLCILISRKTVARSPDCRTFASFSNSGTLRKLFRMGKGSVSVGLSLDQQGLRIPVLLRQN